MNQAEPDIFDTGFDSPAVAVADHPGTIWLDSSSTVHDKGHRSILAEDPSGELLMRGGKGAWIHDGVREELRGDIWETFARLRAEKAGWWIGYISYEAMLPFLGLKPNQSHPYLAELHFYHYDSVVEFASQSTAPIHPPAYLTHTNERSNSEAVIHAAMTKAAYLERVKQVLWHIREGDIYQGNFTSRFSVEAAIKPFLAYYHLRFLNPAPYSAFLNFGEYQILSSSPERMISKQGNALITTPIKGTIPRGTEVEQERNRRRLLDSAKDRAELMMIVDLERNDLGQIAEIGTVEAETPPRAELYSSLIHLVSDVRATLRPDATADDLLRAILPGGSITGAPKRRAVEILSELETVPRGVYTGCIGYFHGDDLEFNIAIRTMSHRNGVYDIHAGSGIVADSDPEAEYDEMQLKARNLFRALEPAPVAVA